MSRRVGLYRVLGTRAYRGHPPGTEFWASLDRNAEARALDRGNITLLARLEPRIEEGSFELPRGWLINNAPEKVSSV